MTRRPPRPLDPQAVKAANESVWKEFGLPAGTQLTLDSKDANARKRWMDAYLEALKRKMHRRRSRRRNPS